MSVSLVVKFCRGWYAMLEMGSSRFSKHEAVVDRSAAYVIRTLVTLEYPALAMLLNGR